MYVISSARLASTPLVDRREPEGVFEHNGFFHGITRTIGRASLAACCAGMFGGTGLAISAIWMENPMLFGAGLSVAMISAVAACLIKACYKCTASPDLESAPMYSLN